MRPCSEMLWPNSACAAITIRPMLDTLVNQNMQMNANSIIVVGHRRIVEDIEHVLYRIEIWGMMGWVELGKPTWFGTVASYSFAILPVKLEKDIFMERVWTLIKERKRLS